MPTITFTITAAEATRITNAAVGNGFPDAKTMVVTYVKNVVAMWEEQQAVQGLVPQSPVSPT